MTREEMLKRLKTGEDPLDLSIEKWERVVKHLSGSTRFKEYDRKVEMEASNCALCFVYARYKCNGCPVKKATGYGCCNKTPYESFREARRDQNLKGMRKAAVAELEFLKSLKKQKGLTSPK